MVQLIARCGKLGRCAVVKQGGGRSRTWTMCDGIYYCQVTHFFLFFALLICSAGNKARHCVPRKLLFTKPIISSILYVNFLYYLLCSPFIRLPTTFYYFTILSLLCLVNRLFSAGSCCSGATSALAIVRLFGSNGWLCVSALAPLWPTFYFYISVIIFVDFLRNCSFPNTPPKMAV